MLSILTWVSLSGLLPAASSSPVHLFPTPHELRKYKHAVEGGTEQQLSHQWRRKSYHTSRVVEAHKSRLYWLKMDLRTGTSANGRRTGLEQRYILGYNETLLQRWSCWVKNSGWHCFNLRLINRMFRLYNDCTTTTSKHCNNNLED